MDFQEIQVERPSRKLAQGYHPQYEAAAFALSIVALCCSCCLYISLPCGALAVIFAILSKGGQSKMSGRACMATYLGIAAIILTIIVYAVAIYTALQEYGSIEGILRAYCDMTGMDFDTLYGQMFQ